MLLLLCEVLVSTSNRQLNRGIFAINIELVRASEYPGFFSWVGTWRYGCGCGDGSVICVVLPNGDIGITESASSKVMISPVSRFLMVVVCFGLAWVVVDSGGWYWLCSDVSNSRWSIDCGSAVDISAGASKNSSSLSSMLQGLAVRSIASKIFCFKNLKSDHCDCVFIPGPLDQLLGCSSLVNEVIEWLPDCKTQKIITKKVKKRMALPVLHYLTRKFENQIFNQAQARLHSCSTIIW